MVMVRKETRNELLVPHEWLSIRLLLSSPHNCTAISAVHPALLGQFYASLMPFTIQITPFPATRVSDPPTRPGAARGESLANLALWLSISRLCHVAAAIFRHQAYDSWNPNYAI
ncbi:hypothetical protein TRAPUB_5386 [Trametes pubescens]|uniref:Uncharacterized protein n=1 Tax=Trametes pubescens TaxID=154538 RepID=A0A1M2V8V6_TRAPU|nr:hypothetical protein TRAPUB_5386 [Trametes pubescens]